MWPTPGTFFFFFAFVPSEKAGSRQSTRSKSHTSITGDMLPMATRLAVERKRLVLVRRGTKVVSCVLCLDDYDATGE